MPTRISQGPSAPSRSLWACRLRAQARARLAARLIALTSVCGGWQAWAASLNLGGASGTRSCTQLHIEADDARCDGAQCVLDGHAQLRCDTDLRLFADHLEVRLGQGQSFEGAQAQGHVRLVDGLKVLRAHALVIEADQIRGRIEAACLEVRRPDAAAPDEATGLRPGRNALVLHGSLERLDASRFVLHDADFTLCDCGPSCLPSWRFDAPRIEVTLDERALILWPQLRINIANRWLMPITPPLLPLSLPLSDRAPGLLPPQITFLQLPYPTIDVPFFMPLGPSWDVTVAPGIRTDWAAARLSARLRYAPDAHTKGRLRASYTHDGRQAMAQQIYTQQLRAHPSLVTDPAFLAEDRALRALTERVSVDWDHATHLPFGALQLDALARVVWVSDDLVNRDLLISPEQRVAAYLPSRGTLMLRHALGAASVAADSMLRLDNPPTLGPGQIPQRDYSNVRGAEATTLHRAPAVHLTLLPVALGAHLTADAQLSAVRYGRWRTVMAQGQTDRTQMIWGGEVGLGFGRQLGPLDMHARAAVDGIYVAEQDAAGFWDAAPLTQADVGLRLARRYGPYWHVIRPQLAYRGVNKAYPSAGPVAQAANDALDARLLRRSAQQALLLLEQSVWLRDALARTGAPPVLSVELGQPLDLRSGQLLQPFAELRLDSPRLGQGSARISIDPGRWHTQPIRELTAQYAVALGFVQAALGYSRMAPDADRFQRSIYELAAPRGLVDPQTRSDWAHLLRATVQARIGRIFNVHYTTLYQLPQPEQPPGYLSNACAAPGQSGGASHCFVSHVVRLGYTSPCDCWGIESVLSGAPQDLLHTLRFQILLNVAGAHLGGQSTSRL